MQIRFGDIWNVFDTYTNPLYEAAFFVTTNSYIRWNRLVMGKGLAKEVDGRFPEIKYLFAEKVLSSSGHLGVYGLVHPNRFGWGAFQTKRDFNDPSDLELIAFSAGMLKSVADYTPYKKVHVNFPGIGCGGLREEDVYPILMWLPDNVYFWKLP